VLGCFVNGWMHRLSGGAWGDPVRAAALRAGRCMPWLLLGLVPIALGAQALYPWADPASGWTRGLARPAFVQAWLSLPFFVARLAGYALVWWWLTRPASLAGKGRAAASLLLHTVLTSLAAVDLLMSLVPGWYSTGFGLVVLSAQALSGAAAVALVVAFAGPVGSAPAGGVPLSRDIGNLLLMWTMAWAYVAFMQFLIIWAENLPREIAWYLPRLQTGWVAIAVALVLLQLVLPFLALLSRAVKDRPARLAVVAVVLLAATMLDAAWLVLPSVDAHSLHGWWLAPLSFLGVGCLAWAALQRAAPGGVRHG
jgi:hypothetical protein